MLEVIHEPATFANLPINKLQVSKNEEAKIENHVSIPWMRWQLSIMQMRCTKLVEKQKINEFSDKPQTTMLEIYAKSGADSFQQYIWFRRWLFGDR